MSEKQSQNVPEDRVEKKEKDWPESYYAVIFSSQLSGQDPEGYQKMAQQMETLAQKLPGYLGIESARTPQGQGITISYWTDQNAIADWKKQTAHRHAQETGKSTWYKNYRVRVCKVERDYQSQ